MVDDDPNSAFILRKILSRTDYRLAGAAQSSEQALQLAQEAKPDLILMDINIPGAHDGIETAKRILRERMVPIVYLTAYSDEATIARARRTAPFAYLLKPYREKEVLITIEMALYKARLDREHAINEQRLAATLGALEDYVVATDAAGCVTYLNPAAERALGRKSVDCLGQHLSELLDVRERDTRTRVPEMIERLLLAGFHTDPAHPLLLMGPRGDAQLVQVQTNLLAEPDGRPPGRVVILRDVTQLSQLEESIRQAQKLEAIGRLASGIAHDFNNLLAIINSFTDLLLLKSQPGDPLEKYYRNIRAAGQRGADLVSRLMTFSRRSSSEPCPVAPAEVVAEVYKMIRPLIRENIELAIEAPPVLPQLNVDPGQIEQILVNLCLNARDAIVDTGRITIGLTTCHFTREQAREHNLQLPGAYLLISVKDNGCGIPADLRKKIFEPFFTTKEVGKGTGLGLAMVYTLVKQNHGQIELESQPNVGTTFTILLPVGETPSTTGVAGGHERVLLVEDDHYFSDCIKNLLDMHGYQTVTAASGEEALDVYEQHNGEFDLLLTDLVLPKLSGSKLAAQLRAKQPSLRVMYMTGYENVEPETQAGPGADRMDKPFSLNALLARIRQLLDQPVSAPGANGKT
jgi:two-component system, cell cycle sensor histidine kinase and response regulator CckA